MTQPDDEWDGGAPWIASYPAGVPASYAYPAVPVGRLLDDAAQDFPDAVAIEYRRYRMTYRKLADHVDRLATSLTALGVAAGDTVALVLPTCPQHVIALFAIWRLGAVVAPLRRDDAAALSRIGPRVVITMDRWYDDVVSAAGAADGPSTTTIVSGRDDYLPFPRNVVWALGTRLRRAPRDDVLRFADLIRRSHPTPPEAVTAADRAAVRREAEVVAAQRHLVVNSFQLRLWLPDVVAGDERVLVALPSSSVVGIVWVLTAVLSAATMILVDNARASQRQRAAMQARPTILPLDAGVVDDLLRPSWRRGSLGSVRIAVSTDPLDGTTSSRLEQLTDKGRVRRAWGIGGLVTHADPIYGRVEPTTVGLPLPDTAVAVVDPDTGARCHPGARGHLWIRGPQLCADGWVDAAVDATLDADGYLTLLDGPPRPAS